MKLDANFENGELTISKITSSGGFKVTQYVLMDSVSLYEVPAGGDERYIGEWSSVAEAVKEGLSWT